MKFNSKIIKESILKEKNDNELGIKFIESIYYFEEKQFPVGYRYKYIFEYNGKYYYISDGWIGGQYIGWSKVSEKWEDIIDCKEVQKVSSYDWVEIS